MFFFLRGAAAPPSPLTTHTPGGLQVVTLGPYAGSLAEQVRALKYAEETRFAPRLGRRLGRVLPADWHPARLVPIPLHPARLAERGYNQAALLARGIAKTSRLRVEFDLLVRRKQTEVQARLDKLARAANADGAFVVRAMAPLRLVLVDDVATTGATLEAAATALAAAGHVVLGAAAIALGGDDARERPLAPLVVA